MDEGLKPYLAIEDSYLGVLGFSPSIFTSLVVIGVIVVAIVVVFAMVFAENRQQAA
jgi:hypothetical protein